MKKRAIGEHGDLYDFDSKAHHGALSGLRRILLEVGFAVDQKGSKERTLRVYPVRSRQYPLINPFFVNSGQDFDPTQKGECLVLSVLYKGDFPALDRHLLNFQSRRSYSFAPYGIDGGGYHRPGHFLVPLSFGGQKAPYRLDFEHLRQSLEAIYQHLRRW